MALMPILFTTIIITNLQSALGEQEMENRKNIMTNDYLSAPKGQTC